jgi:hypothetical protein
VGQVNQHVAGVHEVEGRLGKGSLANVARFDITDQCRLPQDADVAVDGEDPSTRCDTFGEPARDRACAGAHFEAAPARADAQRGETRSCCGVEDPFDGLQAFALGDLLGIREDVGCADIRPLDLSGRRRSG